MKKLLLFFLLLSGFVHGQHVPDNRQKRIFFEGNSIMNYGYNVTAGFGYGNYIPIATYTAVHAAHPPVAYSSYAVTSRTQTMINASQATNITPIVRKGDIVVVFEGTNDIYVNNLTGAQAWANVVTYINALPAGVKLVLCTSIARNTGLSVDPDEMMIRIGDYNTLIRNNAATYGYTVCDLAADPLFDEKSDADNTTYYIDKLHLAGAGQDRVVTLMSATINGIL